VPRGKRQRRGDGTGTSLVEYQAMLAAMTPEELAAHEEKKAEYKAKRDAEHKVAKERKAVNKAKQQAEMAIAATRTKPRRRPSRKAPGSAWRRLKPGTGLCTTCGVWAPLTKDHIIPRSHGGTNALANMQLICKECNTEKGDSLTWVAPLKRRSWQTGA
jgi:5-methylcytosine-specific restriction endonuclease McrA